MRDRVPHLKDTLLLRKRAIRHPPSAINHRERQRPAQECLSDRAHAPSRGLFNFLMHLLADLTAYFHLPKKPSLHLDGTLDVLPVAWLTPNARLLLPIQVV